MPEITAANGQKIIVDDEEYEIARKYNWRITKQKKCIFPITFINNKRLTFSKVVFEIEPGQAVYHKNKDSLDYRKSNIIVCSRRIFGYLTSSETKKKAKYFGVTNIKGSWVVRFRNESGRLYQEKYDSEDEAALAADYHAVINYGDLARRNFIGLEFDELAEKYQKLRIIASERKKERKSKSLQGLSKVPAETKCSSYVGVTWDSQKRKWAASVTFNRKYYHLGRYETEAEATIAYDKKVVDLFGTDVRRNFPELSFKELNIKYDRIVSEINRLSLSEKLSRVNQGKPKLPPERKTSKYVGVSWNKKKKMWVAQITHNYRCISIGFFETEEKAARAYDSKAIELFGGDAKLNFRN